MKLTIPRKELLSALAAVKPVAGGPLPIYQTILLAASGRSLALTAANPDLAIRLKTEAVITTEGEATCRATLLQDIIKMSDGVDVTLSRDNTKLTVECGQTEHNVTTLSSKEFPPFPQIKGPATIEGNETKHSAPLVFTLDDSRFRTMLAETVFACSTDEKRPVLNGVFLKVAENQLIVAGCSGFMLAESIANVSDSPAVSLIIPSGTARELLRLLSTDAEKPHRLTVTTGQGQIRFEFADISLVSKLIEGAFPDYRGKKKIIPDEDTPTASVARVELLRSVGRVNLVAEHVKLGFTQNRLKLTSVGTKGNELLGDASDKIMVPTWQTVEGVFTTRYLHDILNAIPDTAIELHIKPKGGSLFKAPGREWRAVLMPVDPATLKDKVKAAAKPATQAPTPEPVAPEPAVPVPAPVAPAEPAPSDAAPAAPKSDTLVADLRPRKNLVKAALESKRMVILKVP